MLFRSCHLNVDLVLIIRATFAEILLEDYWAGLHGTPPTDFMPVLFLPDCRSSYDAIAQEGSLHTIEGKRTALEAASIIDLLGKVESEDLRRIIRWFLITEMPADCLTKPMNGFKLRHVLQSGRRKLAGISDNPM